MKPDDKLYELLNFAGQQRDKLIDLIEFNPNFITDIEWYGIDHSDAPDYCDAYICYAKYHGDKMIGELLDKLNEDRELVHKLLMSHL